MSATAIRADQLLYTAQQAASVLSLGRSTVYELMASGELKYIKQGRARRIRRVDLEAFVANLKPMPN